MMSARNRTAPARRFAWLLWLALLLPLAQAAAACHGISHPIGQAEHEMQAALALHCDGCVVAAAVSAGALPGAPLRVCQPLVRHALTPTVTPALWLASLALAYCSRAPPSTVH